MTGSDWTRRRNLIAIVGAVLMAAAMLLVAARTAHNRKHAAENPFPDIRIERYFAKYPGPF